ncbi:MAG: family permease [Naasia sp.]|jgi:APA family basic amino acid/polyamine antiporter|uniref:APC family permease n=1 Tax=Naasia sp. TaxID=2546198 RepID=UPI0026084A87|nr:APC family permease [Naasia sp.]MCU1571031.1 family permease [Naasia sp.]
MAVTEQSPRDPQHELKRVMGPRLLLLFIVGDILGTGIYALTGQVAAEVGGAAWLPFLIAFAVALVTACSYLELVTKFPQAAGAALYAHKAFGIHFVTFLVCFTVMSSGITSASAASGAFASNFAIGFGLGKSPVIQLTIALAFILLIALVNLRGVAESVGLNVVLTLVELSGLLLVIFISLFAIFGGQADFSRVVAFETPDDKNVFLAISTATSLAFFAMVGFEDSVNMAEETKDPSRIFPRIMLTGLGITAVIYVLVSVVAVALVPVGRLAGNDTPLVTVVETAAPDFPISVLIPFISLFAVANSALINMMMASRLLYGMSRQRILPPFLSRVLPGRRTPWAAILFTTAIALGLIAYISLDPEGPIALLLGGTTSLLLLAVFAVVNVAVLVLRRQPVDHDHFRTPSVLPVVGALACVYLVLPWTSGRDPAQYEIALILLVIGVVLWAVTWLHRRRSGYEQGEIDQDFEKVE